MPEVDFDNALLLAFAKSADNRLIAIGPINSNARRSKPIQTIRSAHPARERLPCKSTAHRKFTVPTALTPPTSRSAPRRRRRRRPAGAVDRVDISPAADAASRSHRSRRRPQRPRKPDPQPDRRRHLRHAGKDGHRHGTPAGPDGLVQLVSQSSVARLGRDAATSPRLSETRNASDCSRRRRFLSPLSPSLRINKRHGHWA